MIERTVRLDADRRNARALKQRTDSTLPFAGPLRLIAGHIVETGSRVGVDKPERFVLRFQMLNDPRYRDVFHDIGKITGVKGVAITQHVRSLRGPCWAPSNDK